MKPLLILTILAALFTLVVLLIGVVAMSQGGDFNQKWGNKLMQMRVAGQAITIFLIILMAFSN